MSVELKEVGGGDGGTKAGMVIGTEADGVIEGAEVAISAIDDGTVVALAGPGFLCFFEAQKPS